MKTEYLDKEIEFLDELEVNGELIPLEIEKLKEFKQIKEKLILSGVVKSLKDKKEMTFDEYKWKFFDRQSDYKWSRKTDGYVHSKEDVYLEWRG